MARQPGGEQPGAGPPEGQPPGADPQETPIEGSEQITGQGAARLGNGTIALRITNNPPQPEREQFPQGSQTVTFGDGAVVEVSPGTIRRDDPADHVAEMAFAGTVGLLHGCQIMTPDGPVAVQKLRPGDMVRTRDNGPQPLRWIGMQRLVARGHLAPVIFAPGAHGNDQPLTLMPAQRMLICDWRADLMFGEPEVLVAAKDMANGETIRREEGGPRISWQLLFDRHQVITVNGALTESFHPGEQSLAMMAEQSRDRLLATLPHLRSSLADGYGGAIRPSLKSWEIKYLFK
ncbi:MAG: Hint domain-containing protein [Pseudomonadota bacterium]